MSRLSPKSSSWNPTPRDVRNTRADWVNQTGREWADDLKPSENHATIGDKSVETIVENRTTSRKSVVCVKFQAPSSPIQCWTKGSSHEQHCMGEGVCGWRFWLVVYRHLSWIYVFYKFSQYVLSPIVGWSHSATFWPICRGYLGQIVTPGNLCVYTSFISL